MGTAMMKSMMLALGLMLFPFATDAQTLPTELVTDDIMKVCAGGRVSGAEVRIKAELNRFLTGASASGEAKLKDFGAIIDKLRPDSVGVEFYKVYTQCVKDQAETELKQYNVKILDKLSEIDTRVRAQPFIAGEASENFSENPAHIMLRKVRVGTKYDTVIRILDAACDIYVWGAMWVFPVDRTGDPVILIKMTESGKIARDYPFEFRFNRASKVVDDAGFATRDAEPIDMDHQEFLQYALSGPDEIQIYMAFRPVGPNNNCAGSYVIDYEPKTEAKAK
jgi:hypothetical protein